MKTVMLFGTFDILHVGHINLFQQARRYGNKLVVVISRDVNVKKNKKHKPLFNQKERMELLETVSLIDEVVLGSENNYYKVIKKYKPDIIVLGYDQKDYVVGLKDFLQKNNLSTQIIRLKSYKKEKYKSHKVREHIESII